MVIKNSYVFLCVLLFDRTCLILQLYILYVIRKSVHKSRNTIQAQINVYSCDPLLKSLLESAQKNMPRWTNTSSFTKHSREPLSFAVVKLNMKSEHTLVYSPLNCLDSFEERQRYDEFYQLNMAKELYW